MSPVVKIAPSQTESISFEFDLHHSPEKVSRALTDPVLLAEWLLPVVDLKLEPVGTLCTFDARLLADAAHPLVTAGGRVPGLACLPAFESTWIHILATAEERSEQRDLDLTATSG